MGVSLPDVLWRSVAEFYALHTRKEVSVDAGALTRIRKEALHTQEKLVVPEETDVRPPAAPIPALREKPAANGWASFGAALTQTELEALKVILQSGDLKGFAAEKGVMPEALVDGVNQKAADAVGDVVIEFGDTATVYDEYREKLAEILNTTS
jgi:hypothetical protein